MSWSKLPPHPGLVIVGDGAHRAYINTRLPWRDSK